MTQVIDTAETQIEPHNGRLATANRDLAPPSIESILMTAIEQRIDPAALEKLVALQERISDRRAVQAFNQALHLFRAECPAIVKNREAIIKDRVAYRFADLSEITKIVDPFLFKNGFSYRWDTEVVADQTSIICHLSHVEGHRESSRFTCKGSGTPMMNAAQVSASATTFGKRHSLVNVLGITVDDDDDGRRAAPMPSPDADPQSPIVLPREQRVPAPSVAPPEPEAQRVTKEQLALVTSAWRKIMPEGTREQFIYFVDRACGFNEPSDRDWFKLSAWEPKYLDACLEALK